MLSTLTPRPKWDTTFVSTVIVSAAPLGLELGDEDTLELGDGEEDGELDTELDGVDEALLDGLLDTELEGLDETLDDGVEDTLLDGVLDGLEDGLGLEDGELDADEDGVLDGELDTEDDGLELGELDTDDDGEDDGEELAELLGLLEGVELTELLGLLDAELDGLDDPAAAAGLIVTDRPIRSWMPVMSKAAVPVAPAVANVIE